MKRSATETWKSITVNQYEIDVRSRTGNSFIEYIRRLIYQRQHQSLKHCLVGKLAARDAVASRLGRDERRHGRVRPCQLVILIHIPAETGLTAKPAGLADLILNFAVTPFRIARGLLPSPVSPGDIEP